jgi:hypothetical protein
VLPVHWFLRLWNAQQLRGDLKAYAKTKRRVVRRRRARLSVAGVEYWAVSDGSASARLVYAVRAEGHDRYTYFDTGEGWTLSGIERISRRRDRWTPLIAGVVRERRSRIHAAYLPRLQDF